ncbi:hypothetical protein SGPA1_11340 [Streptomyces misionensis JCM 4497]
MDGAGAGAAVGGHRRAGGRGDRPAAGLDADGARHGRRAERPVRVRRRAGAAAGCLGRYAGPGGAGLRHAAAARPCGVRPLAVGADPAAVSQSGRAPVAAAGAARRHPAGLPGRGRRTRPHHGPDAHRGGDAARAAGRRHPVVYRPRSAVCADPAHRCRDRIARHTPAHGLNCPCPSCLFVFPLFPVRRSSSVCSRFRATTRLAGAVLRRGFSAGCASRQAGGPAEGRLVVIRLGAGVMAGPVERTAPDDYGRLERHDMVAPARHEGARPHQEEL